MHEDTNTTPHSEQSEGTAETTQQKIYVNHVYYEISNDLLSKPTALCDILETEGTPSTVVFCNSPSDVDLVEVMLKKRGISAKKLVGHLPPAKVVDAVKQTQRGELAVLVVTDIAARSIEVEDVDLIVNYSVPSDPEIYIHRMGRTGNAGKRHTVISFVSPLDIGNFHYIKKFVETPFKQADLPTKESMAGIKLKNLSLVAERQALHNDPGLLDLVKQALASDTKESLIAMLLHNTLTVLPGLRASAEREHTDHSAPREEGNREERFSRGPSDGGRGRGDRNDRGGRGRGDRRGGRNDRDNRDEDRGNRGGGRGRDQFQDDDFVGQEAVSQDNYDDQGGEGMERAERGGRFDDQDDRPRGRRQDREREPYVPPQRDVRIYIGSGTRHGLSEQKFRELMTQSCPGMDDKIKRFSQRDCYAFVDIAEEAADEVVAKLDSSDLADGGKLMLRKAISINVPRENDKPRDEMDGQLERSETESQDMAGPEESAGENY
ncbi:MAG: hypothetical protein J0M12_11075 [Deltaproteobacteria bacterium]|nr:hypothetical protein [Deltaproteobacteria bacterium]